MCYYTTSNYNQAIYDTCLINKAHCYLPSNIEEEYALSKAGHVVLQRTGQCVAFLFTNNIYYTSYTGL